MMAGTRAQNLRGYATVSCEDVCVADLVYPVWHDITHSDCLGQAEAAFMT